MDPRRRDKIRHELKKADDYLRAADVLHRQGLYTPSVMSAYYASLHATIAAFLTSGDHPLHMDPFGTFTGLLSRFSSKLDPFVEKVKAAAKSAELSTSLDYAENEAMLRLYQTREFFLEVKDFLRRTVKV